MSRKTSHSEPAIASGYRLTELDGTRREGRDALPTSEWARACPQNALTSTSSTTTALTSRPAKRTRTREPTVTTSASEPGIE